MNLVLRRFFTTNSTVGFIIGASIQTFKSGVPRNYRFSIKSLTPMLTEVYYQKPANLFSISVSGGAAATFQWMMSIPGASNSLVYGNIPYSIEALTDSLNVVKIDGACSSATARLMAIAAYKKTVRYLLENRFDELSSENVFAVSCTAALVSDRPKKGDHRCHICVHSKTRSILYSVVLDKVKERSREEEDVLCSKLVINAIRTQCNLSRLDDPFPVEFGRSIEDSAVGVDCVVAKEEPHLDVFDSLYSRAVRCALFMRNSFVESSGCSSGKSPSQSNAASGGLSGFMSVCDISLPRDTVVCCGAFNPVHAGHVAVAKATLDKIGCTSSHPLVVFDLSLLNADKPAIPREELRRRLEQFADEEYLRAIGVPAHWRIAVSVTTESLFVGKASIFRNCVLPLGADTFARLLDAKYYPAAVGKEHDVLAKCMAMVEALSTIRNQGCRFVVSGRQKQVKAADGTVLEDPNLPFETMESILAENPHGALLPQNILDMFMGLTEAELRLDISSSRLRQELKLRKTEKR